MAIKFYSSCVTGQIKKGQQSCREWVIFAPLGAKITLSRVSREARNEKFLESVQGPMGS
jgi:hypothetical protein